jgi:mannosyltransferase OCH1-like enzyme
MFNKIPKTIHFYWDGSPMPFLCFLTVFSFTKLNPDWKIKIYSPLFKSEKQPWLTDEQKIKYNGKDYFSNLKDLENCSFITFDFEKIGISNEISEVQKSDFLRWHLLSTEGGVWSDFDIIYFRSLKEINMANQMVTEKNKEIDFSICYDFNNISKYKHSIGFLMAVKECNFYKNILQAAIKNFNEYDYQGAGSQILNEKYANFINLYFEEKNSNIWNMSMDILYAYNSDRIKEIYESQDLRFFTQNSIGIHFYYGSEITKKFIQNFEEKKINKNVLLRAVEKFYLNTM